MRPEFILTFQVYDDQEKDADMVCQVCEESHSQLADFYSPEAAALLVSQCYFGCEPPGIISFFQ
jgi:hypothetical protein